MSVDITNYFLDYVKSLETKFVENHSNAGNRVKDNLKSDFKIQSVDLLESIFSLRQILETILENYASIIPLSVLEKSNKCHLMEMNATKMLNLCLECLTNLKSNKYIGDNLQKDIRLHRTAVCEMLGIYIKGCQQLFDEINQVKKTKVLSGINGAESLKRAMKDEDGAIIDFYEGDNLFDAGEMKQLQLNSDGVHKRLNVQLEEKEEIERQITQLSRMNEQLAENVLEQHQLVERIEGVAVNSSLNIDCGNQQLQSAMQNQSSLRFWVLFIILVLGISVIFIDWYNT